MRAQQLIWATVLVVEPSGTLMLSTVTSVERSSSDLVLSFCALVCAFHGLGLGLNFNLFS